MICKFCNKAMIHLLRFENGKSYELYKCSNCYSEGKKNLLKFDKTKTEKDRTDKKTTYNKPKVEHKNNGKSLKPLKHKNKNGGKK